LLGAPQQNDLELANRRSTKVAQAEEQQAEAHGQIEEEVETKPVELQEPA
jgi:hypothetical protein